MTRNSQTALAAFFLLCFFHFAAKAINAPQAVAAIVENEQEPAAESIRMKLADLAKEKGRLETELGKKDPGWPLKGKWKSIRAELSGSIYESKGNPIIWEFKDAQVTRLVPGQQPKLFYWKVDLSTHPYQIDEYEDKEFKTIANRGIFMFDSGDLLISSDFPEHPRPTKFRTPREAGGGFTVNRLSPIP